MLRVRTFFGLLGIYFKPNPLNLASGVSRSLSVTEYGSVVGYDTMTTIGSNNYYTLLGGSRYATAEATLSFKTTSANLLITIEIRSSSSSSDYMCAGYLDDDSITRAAVKVSGNSLSRTYTYTISSPGNHYIKFFFRNSGSSSGSSNRGYFRLVPFTNTEVLLLSITEPVEVKSYSNWTLYSKSNWITISPTSSSKGKLNMQVTATPNYGNPRTGNVVLLELKKGGLYTLVVNLEASPNRLELSKHYVTVNDDAGSVTVDVSLFGTSTSWSVPQGSWYTISPTSGGDGKTVTISWGANNGGERNATLVFTGNNGGQDTLILELETHICHCDCVGFCSCDVVLDCPSEYTGHCYCDTDLQCSCDSVCGCNYNSEVCSCNNETCTCNSNRCSCEGNVGCTCNNDTCSCNTLTCPCENDNCSCEGYIACSCNSDYCSCDSQACNCDENRCSCQGYVACSCESESNSCISNTCSCNTDKCSCEGYRACSCNSERCSCDSQTGCGTDTCSCNTQTCPGDNKTCSCNTQTCNSDSTCSCYTQTCSCNTLTCYCDTDYECPSNSEYTCSCEWVICTLKANLTSTFDILPRDVLCSNDIIGCEKNTCTSVTCSCYSFSNNVWQGGCKFYECHTVGGCSCHTHGSITPVCPPVRECIRECSDTCFSQCSCESHILGCTTKVCACNTQSCSCDVDRGASCSCLSYCICDKGDLTCSCHSVCRCHLNLSCTCNNVCGSDNKYTCSCNSQCTCNSDSTCSCVGICNGYSAGASCSCNNICHCNGDWDCSCVGVCAGYKAATSCTCNSICRCDSDYGSCLCDGVCGSYVASKPCTCNGVCQCDNDYTCSCVGVCITFEAGSPCSCNNVCHCNSDWYCSCDTDCTCDYDREYTCNCDSNYVTDRCTRELVCPSECTSDINCSCNNYVAVS